MKNKAFFSLLFFMAFYFAVNAQNLVPNYSFENYSKCVSHDDEFTGYVSDWTGQESVGGLGWFTSQCADTTPKYQSAGVPYNVVGFQYAHTGVSYALMITFINGTSNTVWPYSGNAYKDVRNYMQVKLIDSLKSGTTYYVNFFVSLPDSSDYACSDIGAYISDSALNLSGNLVKSYIVPQVANSPTKQKLTDTLNWMKVSGNFVASGGEKYIVIGNFKNDSLSSITYLGDISPDATAAYYYIDDVIVSPDSAYADSLFASVPGINQPKEVIQVFPNPSKGLFTFNLQGIANNCTIEIYNMLGENVYEATLPQTSGGALNTIDLSKQPQSIYLYRVITEQGNAVASGKLVIQ